MITFCINYKTEFYDHVKDFVGAEINKEGLHRGLTKDELNTLIKEKIAEITDKLNQEQFDRWYGEGARDSFGQPRIVDEIYLVNDKGIKISLRDLFNDNYWETRENYSKDFTTMDKIKEFLDDSQVAIGKRISAFKGSKYAERLTQLLEYLKSLDETEHVKALVAHHNYMLKTLNGFELELKKHDREKGVKANHAQDKEYKNFLIQAHNFLNSFSKIRNLDAPVIETSEEKEVIDNLKKLDDRITEMSNRIDSEIEGVIRDRLEEYISNPEVKAGVIDFLAAQTDESKVQLMLDALGDSHITFIAAIDKLFKRAMYDRDQAIKDKLRDWDKFVKSFGGQFDNFLDRVLEKVDGKRTGRFVPKYKEDFYTEMYEKRNLMQSLKNQGKTNTKEYQDALNEWYTWKKDNVELPYKKEYYDSLNLLIPQARQLREEIDRKKASILNRAKNNLTDEDLEELRALEVEMNQAKSDTYIDGTPKTGEDLAIANSLFKYSKQMSKFYHTVGIYEKDFEKARKRAEEKAAEKNDPEAYQRWLANNTVEEFSDQFWTFFEDLKSKMPKNKELEKVQDDIKQLTIAYRNKKGEIKVNELPADVRKRLDELYNLKDNIKAALNESISQAQKAEISEAFRRFIIFPTTSEYDRTFAEMNKKRKEGEITEDEYNRWFYKNHSINEYTGEVTPISIWTKMRPADPKFIVTKPNKHWRKTDIKPEYRNPNFAEDDNGNPLPMDKWLNDAYRSLNEEDREKLEELREMLLELTAHTKNDIIKRGYLPAVPKDDRGYMDLILNRKKSNKVDSTDAIVTESDDIVKFIPFLYVKKLNQAALPQLGTGATEAENKEIEEKRKSLISENRQSHGDAIDYNLAETMKAFIKTALNHKYKSAIEIDMKLFKEQMKRQKIKVTNAKGDKVIDKIKSRLTGNLEEHEVNAVGSNMEKHFKEWLDGVFYEDFEKDEGWLSEGVNKLLNLTSMTTLGFNVFSGLNNKLIGNLQARIEAAGGIHFGYSDYRVARKQYAFSLTNYVTDHNTDKASSITNGLIKYFDVVVSQDELSRKPEGKLKTILHKAKMLKSAAYFMQHLGEHQVQNTALIAMAHSHRVVDGKILNFNEFWEKHKAQISFDKEMTAEQMREEFLKIDQNLEIKKTMKEEFEKHPKLIDVYELQDGYLKVKEGIILDKNEEFNFQQRVVGVNQRMHGIYNTEDAALAQRHALGRLAMQFRKWMRPMWNKRFGRRFGKRDWNERVRDYEEGMYVSTFKYVFGPAIDNWKAFQKEQQKIATKAFLMILNSVKDTFTHARIRWHVMSEVEKANVKRTAAEFLFLVSVTMLGFALKHLKGEEDDDEDKKLLVLGLYQADRLFGELTTFTPIGIVRDGNRLFSSPAPVFSTLEDIFKLGASLTMYPFRDEENRTFKSGIYHGEYKHEIYLKGLIPFLNQIQKWEYMGEHNQRYGAFR